MNWLSSTLATAQQAASGLVSGEAVEKARALAQEAVALAQEASAKAQVGRRGAGGARWCVAPRRMRCAARSASAGECAAQQSVARPRQPPRPARARPGGAGGRQGGDQRGGEGAERDQGRGPGARVRAARVAGGPARRLARRAAAALQQAAPAPGSQAAHRRPTQPPAAAHAPTPSSFHLGARRGLGRPRRRPPGVRHHQRAAAVCSEPHVHHLQVGAGRCRLGGSSPAMRRWQPGQAAAVAVPCSSTCCCGFGPWARRTNVARPPSDHAPGPHPPCTASAAPQQRLPHGDAADAGGGRQRVGPPLAVAGDARTAHPRARPAAARPAVRPLPTQAGRVRVLDDLLYTVPPLPAKGRV
jgi:hypothetical protein